MYGKFRPLTLLFFVLGFAVISGFSGGCSPEQYKADADKEVYQIIDEKWEDGFGQKANYIISDCNTVFSPIDIPVEKVIPPSGVISLSEAVAIATKYNRTYKTRKETLYQRALDLTGTRYTYAIKWFGTVDGTYTDDKSAGDDVTIQTSTETSKRGLLLDGVIYNASIAVDWLRFLTGDPRTSLGSLLSGDVTIPLLGRGAGKTAQENLTLAERSVLYQIRTFNRYRKQFIVDIVDQYYNILERRANVINAENNYKSLLESRKRLEIEVGTGTKAPSDVDETEQQLLSAENSWVRAQQTYEGALDQFKVTLTLPTDADIVLDPNELLALEKIGISQVDYTTEMAIETARQWRLDLANSADAVEDAERNLVLAAEGLGVQLDLTGSMDVDSPAKTKFDRLQFQKGVYSLGFEADLPFDRVSQRNAYREALITLEQRIREYEDDQDNIELGMRAALRDLKAKAEQYRIQQMALVLAQRRKDTQEMLLSIGQGSTRLLLDAQSALLRAQDDVTNALVAHAVAKLGFYRDVGILQVKPDGMWEAQEQ
ncbi:MAG: TolC family protein [Sedimentisphaerales bacterium]|nr:TolC family protein [Sedimentisphaerales bacterium]